MSLEIDEAVEGMQLIAIITAIHHTKPAGVELSLLNSFTHGKLQKPLEDFEHSGNTFYRLGLQRIEPKFKLQNFSAVDRYIVLDEQSRSYNALETLISELGVSEFATLKYAEDKMIYQSNINFDYTKLRDMQNIDWAEESIKYGETLKAQGAQPEAVLKYYESAIGLDPLNKAAYIFKGDALIKMNKLEDAVDSYKVAIKLDSNDKATEKKLENLLMSMRKTEHKKESVILEEEGQPKLLLLQKGRDVYGTYSMTFDESVPSKTKHK